MNAYQVINHHEPPAMEVIEGLLDKILSISQDKAVIEAVDKIADICGAYMDACKPPACGAEFGLTPAEGRVWQVLLRRRGITCSKQSLLVAARVRDGVKEKLVDIHVMRIKRKLPEGKFKIRTVRGEGYVLAA